MTIRLRHEHGRQPLTSKAREIVVGYLARIGEAAESRVHARGRGRADEICFGRESEIDGRGHGGERDDVPAVDALQRVFGEAMPGQDERRRLGRAVDGIGDIGFDHDGQSGGAIRVRERHHVREHERVRGRAREQGVPRNLEVHDRRVGAGQPQLDRAAREHRVRRRGKVREAHVVCAQPRSGAGRTVGRAPHSDRERRDREHASDGSRARNDCHGGDSSASVSGAIYLAPRASTPPL